MSTHNSRIGIETSIKHAQHIVNYYKMFGNFPKGYYGHSLLTRWKLYLIGHRRNVSRHYTVCPDEVNQYLTEELGDVWINYKFNNNTQKKYKKRNHESMVYWELFMDL